MLGTPGRCVHQRHRTGFAAAGIAAFLAGEIKVEGDLAQLIAMQTVEPSAAQLRLTQQIAGTIKQSIEAEGVGVVIEAQHLCMMMRGVEKQNSTMVTSSVLGVFRDSLATREEFFSLIGRRA